MHPKIKKFWEDAGFQVLIPDPLPPHMGGRLLWYLKKDGQYFDVVGLADIHIGDLQVDPKCKVYKYKGKYFSEEEMLRLVNLKSFL